MEWYYVQNGEQQGPVSREELDRLAQSGEMPADALVWYEGMENWEPYSSLSDAGSGAESPSAAPSGAAGSEGKKACSQCGRQFAADEMVPFGEKVICPDCKPAFFQKLREGAPAGQGAPAGAQFASQPVAATNGMAIAGFIVSVISIFLSCCWLFGGIGGITGLILSGIGLKNANADPNQSGKGLAIAGVVISIVCCLIAFVMFALFLVGMLSEQM